jgi:hypothetical protein
MMEGVFESSRSAIATNAFVANSSILSALQFVARESTRLDNIVLVHFGKEMEVPTTLKAFVEFQIDYCFRGLYQLNT